MNRLIESKLAGGAGNRGIHERTLLEMMLVSPTDKMCIPHAGTAVWERSAICIWWFPANAPCLEIFNNRPIGYYEYPFAMFEIHRHLIRFLPFAAGTFAWV